MGEHRTPRSRLAGTAAALGAVFIWGLTFVPSKIALAEMGPITLAALRFCVALAIPLPALPPSRLRSDELRQLPWRTLATLGFTGVALYFGFQNLGLARTSATEAGLISGSVPAVTAALSALVLRERLPIPRILGIAGSMAGVAVMILGSSPSGGGSMAGDLLMLVSAVAWAIYTLTNKEIGGKVPDGFLLVSTIAFGALFLAPAAVFEVATAGFAPIFLGGWLSVLSLASADRPRPSFAGTRPSAAWMPARHPPHTLTSCPSSRCSPPPSCWASGPHHRGFSAAPWLSRASTSPAGSDAETG